MRAEDLELLKLADVPTHGVRLPAGPARDRLRRAGLIVSRQPKAGHAKFWIATRAGRDELRAAGWVNPRDVVRG